MLYSIENGMLGFETHYEVSQSGRTVAIKLSSNNVLDILPLNKNANIYISTIIKKDNEDSIYINCLEIDDFTEEIQTKERTVRKYNGKDLTGIARIIRNDLFSPNKSHYVSQEGNLYQMVFSKDSLKVYKLFFTELKN